MIKLKDFMKMNYIENQNGEHGFIKEKVKINFLIVLKKLMEKKKTYCYVMVTGAIINR